VQDDDPRVHHPCYLTDGKSLFYVLDSPSQKDGKWVLPAEDCRSGAYLLLKLEFVKKETVVVIPLATELIAA